MKMPLLILIMALNAHALHSRSAKNEYLSVFMEKSNSNKVLIEGLVHTIADSTVQTKAVLPALLIKAKDAGLPFRYETRSTMGYSPYQVLIVTLLNDSKRKIEIEGGKDLFSTYRLIVTSNSDIFESNVEVDNLSLTTLTLSGQLAQDFKAVLKKIGITEYAGVVSLFGVLSVYQTMTGSNIPSDAACGLRDFGNKEICVIYNNFKK